MIIKEAQDNKVTLSSGIDTTSEFSIKNSAKAFHILSTSLYSDTKLAILRELGCNARDSHVAAGQTRPWELSLPTFSEPTLEIEDFGLGLSNSEVLGLFTTFFESTKTDSNEFVGALGLGSKSPFSYTDNFTIVAVKDGVKNVYSAYKTDAGIPAIARLHTESTSQCNGVKISIAIKREDTSSFVSRVVPAYSFFDQKPKIVRGTQYTPEYNEARPFILAEVDLGVLTLKRHSYNTESYVVMGGIQYKIEASRSEFADYANMLRNNLVFMAGIGDVEMMPSREGLTYNKQTVSWILKQLNKLNKNISVVLEDSMKKKELNSDWKRSEALLKTMHDGLAGTAAKNMHNKLFPVELSVNLAMNELEKVGLTYRTISKSSYKNALVSPVKVQSLNLVMNQSTAQRGLEILFDDKKLLVNEMKSSLNGQASRDLPMMHIFKGDAKAKKWLLRQFAAVGLELVDASTRFKKEPTAKRLKHTHSTISKTGYGYSNAEFRIESSNSEIPHFADYYVPLFNGKVTTTGSVSLPDIWNFIKNNAGKVVGLSKQQEENKPKGLLSLVDFLQKEIDAEIALANTPEGSIQLAMARLENYNYTELSKLKFDSSEAIEDPLLRDIISVLNKPKVVFKYQNVAYPKSKEAQELYKNILDIFQTRYAIVKLEVLNRLDKQTQINLLNLLFNAPAID